MRTWPFVPGMPVFPHLEERAFLFVVGIILPLASCTAAAPARVHEDSARIVSLLPSATDVLLQLGAGDRVVARTDYDTAAVLHAIPSLGRTLSPSAESILRLDPDLVILSAFTQESSALGEIIGRYGAQVLIPEVRSVADIQRLIDTLGVLVNRRDAARALNDTIARRLRELAAKAATRPPTVVYLIWHAPPMIAGPGTYIDELIRIAGGSNIGSDLGSPWPQVSLEYLLQENPDFIVVPGSPGFSAATLEQSAKWRTLAAVRAGRVIEVDGDLFNRPGTQVVQAARVLVDALRSRTATQ
jgi:iron complex transport system substrate-binding protein